MEGGERIIYCIILFAGGLFSIAGSFFNWDFFFNSRKARPFVKLIGRTGARIFYAILGAFIIFCGIMVLVSPA
ncbi:MAG: immunity 17 family protein [Huintestinicola sp.]